MKLQNEYSQLITTSIDGQILVWDIEELTKTKNIQDLDLSWAPYFRLNWTSHTSYPYSCTNTMIKSTNKSFKLFGCTLVCYSHQFSESTGWTSDMG